MRERGDGNRGTRRSNERGGPPRGGPGRVNSGPAAGAGSGPGGGKPKPKKAGGLRLQRLDDRAFALDHPKCIHEMELDYEEGLELRREGDPEAARDALRYALQGCGDNMWVHVALGRIALEDFKDPTLARGHFGYSFELAERAIGRDFDGLLPREHPSNQPLYDAIDGLIACYDALGQPAQSGELRVLARRWLGQA